MNPKIVILELGGNDGLRGVPVASTKANLEKMIVRVSKGRRYGGAGWNDAAAELWS